MDTSEYMPMFLAETREHLQELNLAIVALEQDPSSRETVNAIFRVAHSLKGMSATMGFTRLAELTHVMEDVFELLRQRNGSLSEDAATTVLACVDALEGAVDAIEADGQERLDPEPLIKRLRQLIRERTPEQQIRRSGGADVPTQAAIDDARAAGARVLHVLAALDADVMMPAVRAHMVLAALGDHGELIGSVPAPSTIEHFDGHVIEAWLVSEDEERQVCDAASGVSEVIGVEVQELDGERVVATLPVAAAPPGQEAGATPAPQPPVEGRRPGAGHPASQTVRVDAERLDTLLQLMGELVIHRTAVETYAADSPSRELQEAVQDLTRSSQALQSMVMQIRMIPVEAVFLRLPRLVRDLQAQLGKKVALNLEGRETELDRAVVDALGDPLVHLVRNALDHGLETPAERAEVGKDTVGQLTVAARHAGGCVLIEVSDDGHGVDPGVAGRVAVERGLIDAQAAARLDLRGAIELLFTPGFSTVDATSEVSGRGVGMDAVRANIRELGGEVIMESTPGSGTTVQIRLPLTLAIVAALQVEIGGEPFAIPLDRVERTLRLGDYRVSRVAGVSVLALPDGVIPLVSGAAAFSRPASAGQDLAVVVRSQDRLVALTVDELIGQRELVTRPVPELLTASQPISGGAVLADGRIALIVDCDALAWAGGDRGQPGDQPSRPTTDQTRLVVA